MSGDRTRITRLRELAVDDREALLALLDEAMVCHVGFVRDGTPVVLPSIHAADPSGPDEGGTLYLHGSVGSGWMRLVPGELVCVTVTLLDGLVLARSAFEHSMHYRSAVILGAARKVGDPDEVARALTLMVEQVVPGRAATLRANSRKELAATTVLAVPLAEFSLKVNDGPPEDDPADVAAGVWAGVLPLALRAGEVRTAEDADAPVPEDVRRRAAQLGGSV